MNHLSVSQLYKSYKKEEVLCGITFEAQSGDILGIVGPNGSGKSTLLRTLTGLLKPDSGEVILNEHALSERKYFAKEVGYVPQENPLFDNLSVLDNLRLWYSDTPRNLKEDVKTGLIARFGVKDYLHKRVSTLSGGMKKRLSIVCALAKDPSVLVLDEPGASLDMDAKEDICRYLQEFAAQGGIVLMSTHEIGELAICTRRISLIEEA